MIKTAPSALLSPKLLRGYNLLEEAASLTLMEICLCSMSGYHGMHDWSIGASENHKGVPEAVRKLTLSFTYNDLEDLENKLKANEIAAVILEPIRSKKKDILTM